MNLDITQLMYLKKHLNASRPSEHPLVRGKSVNAFRWDQRLQRQNLFMAFKRVTVLFCVLSLVISERIPGVIWFGPVYLVTTAGFVADQLV